MNVQSSPSCNMGSNCDTPPSLSWSPESPTKEKKTSSPPWRTRRFLGICACSLLTMLALLIALLTIFPRARAVKTLVELDYAKYQGVELSSGINQWLGIRYAAPPVGDLRFANPKDPQKEDTIQAADEVSLLNSAMRTVDQSSLTRLSLATLAWQPPEALQAKALRKTASSSKYKLLRNRQPSLDCPSLSSSKAAGSILAPPQTSTPPVSYKRLA